MFSDYLQSETGSGAMFSDYLQSEAGSSLTTHSKEASFYRKKVKFSKRARRQKKGLAYLTKCSRNSFDQLLFSTKWYSTGFLKLKKSMIFKYAFETYTCVVFFCRHIYFNHICQCGLMGSFENKLTI